MNAGRRKINPKQKRPLSVTDRGRCFILLFRLSKEQIRTRPRLGRSSDFVLLVDLKGIEPSNLTDANRALSQLSYRPKLALLCGKSYEFWISQTFDFRGKVQQIGLKNRGRKIKLDVSRLWMRTGWQLSELHPRNVEHIIGPLALPTALQAQTSNYRSDSFCIITDFQKM